MPVIRVSGNPGSGKTTLCKRLADYLRYGYSYTGGIFREFAKERGLSIEEFYKQVSSNPELEKSIDARQEKLMNERDNLIVEGRMAPFLSCAFKTINVKIAVSPGEGARRQLLRKENKNKALSEMIILSEERMNQERERYRALYGIDDYLADERFDIILDTTELDVDEAFEELLKAVNKLLK